MKNIASLILLVLVVGFILQSCQSQDEVEDFPKMANLSTMKATKFAPVLESPIDSINNYIYGASLAHAWDTITKLLNEPIIELTSPELQTINTSKSYQNSLDSQDIEREVMVTDTRIVSKVSFKKTLDFIEPFEGGETQTIKFNKRQLVQSFGCDGRHPSLEVAYFYDYTDCAVKLLTKDKAHEVYLVKMPMKNVPTMKAMVDSFLYKNIDTVKVKSPYRQFIEKDDNLNAPKIAFNLEYQYPSIEGSQIKTNNNSYTVTKCYQKNAFLMNETGAKVESAAEIIVTRHARAVKNFYFNSSYLIMLYKKGSKYPYFAVLVNNAELLEKAK